ncbi:lysylphosphatidylglycerol synthase domain-containing protein [Spartinivicinus poritis]|uniref:Lysylphosphatidylglycerol synthase domain-containing protein n=1 Tax=Spartinivicinus poritis TaxID=2994640 RepID=A0ABT5U9X6_9GAMM|nr:lysylphosphatidylglycerol synthase domain-containing protein [Spartinivicinus sp. A2-2]MDE1462811.1 lysylphosphatidylglycerol synthase domain-containing protein [Spartinivicinus sp. A2-2]
MTPKKIISITIYIASIVFIILYTYSIKDHITTLEKTNYKTIMICFFLYYVFFFINGFVLMKSITLLKSDKKNKTLFFKISIYSSFYNLITPFKAGSILAKWHLLKKYFCISNKNFISSFVYLNIINYSISLVALNISTIVLVQKYDIRTFLLFDILVTALSIIILYHTKKILTYIKIENLLTKKNLKTTLKITTSLLIQVGIGSLIIYYIFLSIEKDANLTTSIVLFCLINLSTFIAIIPGNIGFREIGLGAISTFINLDFNIVFTVVLVDRIIQTSFIFILSLHYFIIEKTKN